MKILKKAILFFGVLILVSLALPHTVQAAPLVEERTIIGESFILEGGQVLDGDLNVIGGFVEVKATATVNGNVFALGGVVTIDGTINGNVTAIGGTLNLNENAIIEGDLIFPVSYLNIDPNANITGEQIEEWIIPGIGIERFMDLRPHIFRARAYTILPILARVGKTIATALVMAALGAFLLLIMPKPADRMSRALVTSPWQILGYGALSALVLLIVGVFLIVTICFIPVLILIGLTFALAILIGWLALGYELGVRIATSIFKTSWHPVISAALGNLLLYLVAKGFNLIPCIGWFLVFVIMLFSLGIAVVTLFGTYPYPRTAIEDTDNEPVVLFEKEQTTPTTSPVRDEQTTVDVTPPAPSEEFQIQPEAPVVPVDFQTDAPIEDLNLGTRINNILKDAGLTTVNDVLMQLKDGDESMLDINGFGEKSLFELKESLLNMGYRIPESSDE